MDPFGTFDPYICFGVGKMPTDSQIPIGKLFIDANVLLKPKWMLDTAIRVGRQTLGKNRGFDGFLTASTVREGDFSLILGIKKPDPFLALFIGVPGPNKQPIVNEIYVRA